MAPRKLTNGVHISVNTCATKDRNRAGRMDGEMISLEQWKKDYESYVLQRNVLWRRWENSGWSNDEEPITPSRAGGLKGNRHRRL